MLPTIAPIVTPKSVLRSEEKTAAAAARTHCLMLKHPSRRMF